MQQSTKSCLSAFDRRLLKMRVFCYAATENQDRKESFLSWFCRVIHKQLPTVLPTERKSMHLLLRKKVTKLLSKDARRTAFNLCNINQNRAWCDRIALNTSRQSQISVHGFLAKPCHFVFHSSCIIFPGAALPQFI